MITVLDSPFEMMTGLSDAMLRESGHTEFTPYSGLHSESSTRLKMDVVEDGLLALCTPNGPGHFPLLSCIGYNLEHGTAQERVVGQQKPLAI